MVRNTAELKSNNIKRIIDYLRLNPPITKKELSSKLGLSFATVSNLSNELAEDGIVMNFSSENSSGGRIPELLSINEDAGYIVCVTLSKINEVEIAVLNLKESAVASSIYDMSEIFDLCELTDIIYSETRRLCLSKEIPIEKLIGIGVSVPGIHSTYTECVINSTYDLFENQTVKKAFEDAFNLPVYIENEANLLAIASMNHENSEDHIQDLVYYFGYDGVGIGIISGGKLVRGSAGLAGVISHLPIGNRDFKCCCGNRGCIETELVREGILRKMRIVSGSTELMSWQRFIEQAFEKEPFAQAVIKETGILFGKFCSVIINLMDPEVIYVGGSLCDIFDLIYPYAIEEIQKRMVIDKDRTIRLENSKNYKNLIFKGCADMIIKHWQPKSESNL